MQRALELPQRQPIEKCCRAADRLPPARVPQEKIHRPNLNNGPMNNHRDQKSTNKNDRSAKSKDQSQFSYFRPITQPALYHTVPQTCAHLALARRTGHDVEDNAHPNNHNTHQIAAHAHKGPIQNQSSTANGEVFTSHNFKTSKSRTHQA